MRIRADVDRTGVLRTLTASGHAGTAARGQDIVCAAASALLFSVARTLEAADEVDVDGGADRKGELELVVRRIAEEQREWGRGVTEMFLKGIMDLAREHPSNVELTISRD